MTEWGVVTVIVALVGLIAAVAAPMVKLNERIDDHEHRITVLETTADEERGH